MNYSDLASKILISFILLDVVVSIVLHMVAGYEMGIISFSRKSFLHYDFFVSIGDVLILTMIRFITLTPVFWQRDMKELGFFLNSFIILIMNCSLAFLIIKIVSIQYVNSFQNLVGNCLLSTIIIYMNIIIVLLGMLIFFRHNYIIGFSF